MKTKLGELYNLFIKSRGHIDMRVDNVLERIPGIDYTRMDKEEPTIGVKTLFETVSVGGDMTSSLNESNDITNLDKRVIKLTTVYGIQKNH